MSCLDLCYSVKWKRRKEFKDEKKDETSPVILHDLVEEEEDSKEGPLARIDLDPTQVSCSLHSRNCHQEKKDVPYSW